MNGSSAYLLKDNPAGAMVDTFWTTWLPFSDQVARRRGLVSTIDGVHLSARAARGLAGLLKAALNRNRDKIS